MLFICTYVIHYYFVTFEIVNFFWVILYNVISTILFNLYLIDNFITLT